MNQPYLDFQMNNNIMHMLVKMPYTLKELEQKIKDMKYLGSGLIRDPKAEHSRLPSIAKIFYEYLFLVGLPTPEELVEAYLKKYGDIRNETHIQMKHDPEWYLIEGVSARVYRAYPSLLRDFHFYLLCQNANLFEHVYYSLEKDAKDGVDLFLRYKGKDVAIALFVETARSQEFKQKKYKRHTPLSTPEICIPIRPFDAENRLGDFALYRPSHLKDLIAKIEQLSA